MKDADRARFTEHVLLALMQCKDQEGLYIHLPADDQVLILGEAIRAVRNMQDDRDRFIMRVPLTDPLRPSGQNNDLP